MSEITKIELWKDCGFTDGCIEVPSLSNLNLTNPDLTLVDGFHPSKSRMFSEVQIQHEYLALLDYSYMRLTYSYNNSTSNQILYAWIDEIRLSSDTDDYPKTDIIFHIDLWRSYFGSAEFGKGIVRRKPSLMVADYPPQPYSARYVTADMSTYVSLDYKSDGVWWIIVNLVRNVTVGDKTYSRMETRTFPVSTSSSQLYVQYILADGTSTSSTPAMNLSSAIASLIDEKWSLDPESVVSVFACPMCPFNVQGTGTASDPFTNMRTFNPQGWGRMSTVSDSDHPLISNCGYFWNEGGSYMSSAESSQLRYKDFLANKSDDVTTYALMDPEYNVLGVMPWGVSASRAVFDVIVNSNSCILQIRLGPRGTGTNNEIDSSLVGLTYNYVCPTLDVTTNAWSSYVYSGQRQYEMDSREFQTTLNLVSGLTSALTGSAGAYASASIAGKGTEIAGKSAAATAGLNVAGTLIDYGIAKLWANDAMQELSDYQKSKQTNGLQAPGNAKHAIYQSAGFRLVPLVMDSYSQTQRSADIDHYGLHVSEPTSGTDITTMLSTYGPVQITNLIVKGDIPPIAKRYIKQRLEEGVRLVLV